MLEPLVIPLGLLTDRKKFKQIKKPIVLPLKRLSKDVKNYLSSNKLYDFGLEVIPKNLSLEIRLQ